MSGEHILLDVINQRLDEAGEGKLKLTNTQFKYLRKLKGLSERGVILSMADREFLDSIQPDRKIRRCAMVTPRGKCSVGYGDEEHDRCPHWGDWYQSKVKCDGYDPEEVRVNRFMGG